MVGKWEDDLGHERAVLVYFSSPDCGVCHALKPKVCRMVEEAFPRLAMAEVDIAASPGAAAQRGVFVVPTVIVYFGGQETVRLSRGFSLSALRQAIARPYALFFE